MPKFFPPPLHDALAKSPSQQENQDCPKIHANKINTLNQKKIFSWAVSDTYSGLVQQTVQIVVRFALTI